MKFKFKKIGPVDDAELKLGNLTLIAGRNNTGKTYLVYTLYGFLKMWRNWPGIENTVLNHPEFPMPVKKLAMELVNRGYAEHPISNRTLNYMRENIAKALAKDFSRTALSQVFSSRTDDFKKAMLEISIEEKDCLRDDRPFRTGGPAGETIEMQHDGSNLNIAANRASEASKLSEQYFQEMLPYYYLHFLFRELPKPFILSAERFGISLFYKELDFTKNQLVDLLQKIGNKPDERKKFSPFFLIDKSTSHYALPIKDNIDYTRSLPELKKEHGNLSKAKLEDNIKDIMGGYFTSSDDDIRFKSKSRTGERKFDIPLHLASSSARGFSDLYFFLRHRAKKNHLLIIDEPESHLDTANQVQLARLLARFVRAGLKILITTHSDYLIKEINNLIALSQDFDDKETVIRKFKYSQNEVLPPELVQAYMATDNRLVSCAIDSFGIDMPMFDETIDRINRVSNELAAHLEADRHE